MVAGDPQLLAVRLRAEPRDEAAQLARGVQRGEVAADGQRVALPNSRIMLHQPSGGFQGQATDIEIHAKEILALRARLNDIYVEHTGKTLQVIEEAVERDKFLSPEEALEFGLIDAVVKDRPIPEN